MQSADLETVQRRLARVFAGGDWGVTPRAKFLGGLNVLIDGRIVGMVKPMEEGKGYVFELPILREDLDALDLPPAGPAAAPPPLGDGPKR